MEASHFDDLLRSLIHGASRRGVLRGLASTALGVGAARLAVGTRAKKRKKKLKLNEFGCIDVGKPCRGKDSTCCSGICKGKKPKQGARDTRRCAAHDETSCRADQDSCVSVVTCTSSTGFPGRCYVTTGKAGYCGVGNACTSCATDADCVPVLGAGAACVKCANNGCGTPITTVCRSPNRD